MTDKFDDLDDLLSDDEVVPSKPARFSNRELTKSKKTDLPKVQKISVPRTKAGTMVSFLNQKGERITGVADQYYVVRFGGKLHYKEISGVTFLPDGWKEGDDIPGVKVEEPKEEDLI